MGHAELSCVNITKIIALQIPMYAILCVFMNKGVYIDRKGGVLGTTTMTHHVSAKRVPIKHEERSDKSPAQAKYEAVPQTLVITQTELNSTMFPGVL